MIDIKELKDADKGARVYYIPSAGPAEIGVISSWSKRYIFVRFTTGDTAAACRPSTLHWTIPDHFNRSIADRTRA